MAILRILLHGFFLISGNLFSLIAAIVLIQLTSLNVNEITQSIIAVGLNLGIYLLVFKLMAGIQQEIMEIDDNSMFIIILFVSLALLPVVFYPMQYLTNGSWGSFDNIISAWTYQVIVNGICLSLNHFVLDRKPG